MSLPGELLGYREEGAVFHLDALYLESELNHNLYEVFCWVLKIVIINNSNSGFLKYYFRITRTVHSIFASVWAPLLGMLSVRESPGLIYICGKKFP